MSETNASAPSSTPEDLFIAASRQRLRYETPRGVLTVEDLWELPLRGKRADDGYCLDAIALAADEAYGKATKKSFVVAKASKTEAVKQAELALKVVLFIIDTRLAEEAAAKTAADKRKRKAELTEILAKKDRGDLESKTTDEILKMIEELGGE